MDIIKLKNNRHMAAKKEQRKRHILNLIVRPFRDVLDNVDENYGDYTPAKKTIIGVWKLRWVFCTLFAVILVFGSVAMYILNSNTASGTFSFNYEESAKGLNPNSTRLNVYEIKSQDVAKRLLAYCGVEATADNINEVIGNISINPIKNAGANSDSYYIATSYRVSVTKPGFIKDIHADDLILLLFKAYKDDFFDNYGENRDILDFDINIFDSNEFMQVADLLKLKAMQQRNFLGMRVKQSKTFTEDAIGENFKSLSEQVDDFINIDVATFQAFVLESGIAHDKYHYLNALDYSNMMDTLDFKRYMAEYNVRQDGIKLYDEAMISVVMIPTIDRRESTYYMSKTKTGMDYMAKEASYSLTSAQDLAKKIELNQYIDSKMRPYRYMVNERKALFQKADDTIDALKKKLSVLSEKILQLDKAFVVHRTNNYITFIYGRNSIIQKVRLDISAAAAAACFAFIAGSFFVYYKKTEGDKK